MMLCPSCKIEYAEDGEHCDDCGIALVDEPEAADEIAAVAPTALLPAARWLRWIELALVLGVGLLPYVISALHAWWRSSYKPPAGPMAELYLLVEALLSIAVLAYVLYRQGRSLGSIGLTARLSDIPLALILGLCTSLFDSVYGHLLAPFLQHPYPVPKIGPILWLAVIPLAAQEELLARAFLITEMKELTGNVTLAVIASVGLQTVYHLYQGTAFALWAAGSFFVSSIFYVRTRRITPVILAHAFHNFSVFFRY
jgi:membrane protease YdiL (CAAX protease family)